MRLGLFMVLFLVVRSATRGSTWAPPGPGWLRADAERCEMIDQGVTWHRTASCLRDVDDIAPGSQLLLASDALG